MSSELQDSFDDMIVEINELVTVGIDTPNGSRTYIYRPEEMWASPRVAAYLLGTTVGSPAYRRAMGRLKAGKPPSTRSTGRCRRARVVRRSRS